MSYKSVWDFGREGKANYGVHSIGEYPTKIRPLVVAKVVERFSKEGDTILDPFCGSGTVAVEAKLQSRNSINYDINPEAVSLTESKLNRLDPSEMERTTLELLGELERELCKHNGNLTKESTKKEIARLKKRLQRIKKDTHNFCNTHHIVEVKDARKLDLEDGSVDSIITDIPYAGMVPYTEIEGDLSRLEDYEEFKRELEKAFKEMWRVLKKGKYCVVFVADYRIGASRMILPVHSDVIQMMLGIGFTLFDIYIWRYYRSGGFRPFGKPPYQAMNVHIYILCFYKPKGDEKTKPNQPIRYRKSLIKKLGSNALPLSRKNR